MAKTDRAWRHGSQRSRARSFTLWAASKLGHRGGACRTVSLLHYSQYMTAGTGIYSCIKTIISYLLYSIHIFPPQFPWYRSCLLLSGKKIVANGGRRFSAIISTYLETRVKGIHRYQNRRDWFCEGIVKEKRKKSLTLSFDGTQLAKTLFFYIISIADYY